MGIKSIGKRFVEETWLEPVVRGVFSLYRPSIWVPYAERRDNAEMAQVMERVLTSPANCIDVGCHRGDMLRMMLKSAPEGHHVAVEPIPILAAALRENFPQVEVHECALGNEEGEVSFQYVKTNPAYSGVTMREVASHETVEILTVKLTRLDDLVRNDRPIHLMKVDVEGADLQVYKGAAELIARDQPYIIFERGDDPDAVYDLLVGQLGLKISKLGDWLNGRPPLGKKKFATIRRTWNFLAHP